VKQVNIHEAKTHLSRLVEAAAKGESFIIAKAGKPMVRVMALAAADPLHRIGSPAAETANATGQEDVGRRLDRQIAADFLASRLFPDGTDDPNGPLPRIGFMKGRMTLPDDVDGFGREEIAAMFEGGD
jgi:prevent-host-death family protein